MIKVKFYINGFIVENHANFDEYGKDLVCAAVSGIVMGSLNWFDKSMIKEIVVDENIPLIKLSLNESEKNTIGLSLIACQLKEIKNNYSKYLSIKIINEKI